MPLDKFDESFNELLEKGFVETVDLGPDVEPEYRLTAKASDYLYKLDVLKALKQNSSEEIIKRIARSN